MAATRARKSDFYTIFGLRRDDLATGGSEHHILLRGGRNTGYIHVSASSDTKAHINVKTYKINRPYNIGGMEKLAEPVSSSWHPRGFHVSVNLKGFVALVDALGRVSSTCPSSMDYDYPKQDLSIHQAAGLRRLTGDDAIQVVRFRHNNDGSGYGGSQDIGRMQTQQNFLKAVAKQTLTLSNVDKVGEFYKIFQKYVETDLTLGNRAWLGREAITMGSDAISFSTLPGEWHSPYIYLDPEETLSVVNQFLNPYTEDRTLGDLNILTRS